MSEMTFNWQPGYATQAGNVALLTPTQTLGFRGPQGPNVVGPATALDYAALTAASGNWNLAVANAAGTGFARLGLSPTIRGLLAVADGAALRAVLGTGTADATTYYRGDGTWQTVASGGGTWGSITGTLSSQTDLNTALNARALLASANTFTTGGQVIQTGGAGTVGLTLQGASGQTGDLTQWQNSSGVTGVAIRPNTVSDNYVSPMRLVFDDPAGGGSGGSWGWSAPLVGLTARNPANTADVAVRAASFYAGVGAFLISAGVAHVADDFELTQQSWRGADRVLSLRSTSGISWTSGASSGTASLALNQASAGVLRLTDAGLGNNTVLRLRRQSSSTARDVADVTASWATSTDATRQGQLSLGVYGIVSGTETLQTGLTVTATSGGVSLSRFGGQVSCSTQAGTRTSTDGFFLCTQGGSVVTSLYQTADGQPTRVYSPLGFAFDNLVSFANFVVFASNAGFTTNGGTWRAGFDDLSGMVIQPQLAFVPGILIRGFTSQSANLTEWQNSSGTVLASVGPAGTVRTLSTTVASLPAAATAGAGARAFVTDATHDTFKHVAVGGGIHSVPVYSDGTDWRIG